MSEGGHTVDLKVSAGTVQSQNTACASRYLIVFNPVSGRGHAARQAREVAERLDTFGRRCDLRPTTGRGDAQRIANQWLKERTDCERVCVVACGGDGTVQDIANAVVGAADRNAVMGIIPAGRCNDFARALNIPQSQDRVAGVLASGTPKSIDLGRLGERYFCTVAALGFDAAVSRYVNDMRMPLRGPSAYVYGTLRTLLRFETPNMRLSGDFGAYEGPVFLVATANTPWYGGAMRIAPLAEPTDGVADICLVTTIRRWQVLRLLPRVIRGAHADLPEVRMLRTKTLTASLLDDRAAPVELWADGEPLGRTPATIEIVPSAIGVLTTQ